MTRLNLNEDLKDVLFPTIIFLACAIAWYFLYVRPADEFRYAVMGCMVELGDHTEEGYRTCATAVVESRQAVHSR